MEERKPGEANGLPFQGPHWHRGQERELPAAFVPLRLLLQPSGLSVEMSRPEMLVGRHSEADVRLALPDVSRRHCRFVFADNRWQVFDLNSMNGVFVNGQRVQQACLSHRDRISIGSLTFEVDLSAPPQPAAVAGNKGGAVLQSIAEALPSVLRTLEKEPRKAS
jgi:pSer/pThr/pTyr-binding forkhead associated (FHA) protein